MDLNKFIGRSLELECKLGFDGFLTIGKNINY